jgi:hypothetical protein
MTQALLRPSAIGDLCPQGFVGVCQRGGPLLHPCFDLVFRPVQRFFHPLPFGDVLEDDHRSHECPVLPNRRARILNREARAVLRQKTPLSP